MRAADGRVAGVAVTDSAAAEIVGSRGRIAVAAIMVIFPMFRLFVGLTYVIVRS
jgi:hypothetical protein